MALKRWDCRATCAKRVTAMIGHLGRYLAMRWAECPDVVMTMIAAARHLADASTEAIAMVWATSIGGNAC